MMKKIYILIIFLFSVLEVSASSLTILGSRNLDRLVMRKPFAALSYFASGMPRSFSTSKSGQMETLMRFVLTRPAVSQDTRRPSINLSQASKFQSSLQQALKQTDSRLAVKNAAKAFIGRDPTFVGEPSKVKLAVPLRELDDRLVILEKAPPTGTLLRKDVVEAIEKSFHTKLDSLVRSRDLEESIASLKDSVIAIKYVQEEHWRSLEDLTNQLRNLEFVLKIASDADFPENVDELRLYRRRSLMLPTATKLDSSLSTKLQEEEKAKQRAAESQKKREEAEKKLKTYKSLKSAITELTNLKGSHLQSTPQTAHGGFTLPAEFSPMELFKKDVANYQLREGLLLRKLGEKGSTIQPTTLGTAQASPPSGLTFSKVKLMTGSPGFSPIPLSQLGLRLKPETEKGLSEATRGVLKGRNLQMTERALDQVVSILHQEMMDLSQELDELHGRPKQYTFKRMGNAMVMISTPIANAWNRRIIDEIFTLPGMLVWSDSRVPHSHGNVSASGVADLIVVKQQLIGYEAADVAHIENILKGERKEREHTRRRETQELTFRETETTTSEERELESTNRFELSREVDETIKEDALLKAGLTVSGKYGPVVEFSASAEGALARSREESVKSAAKFSQDVVEKSARKVTERVLERSSLQVTNEVIEKNTHLLDNVGGPESVSGVYQWVNKVYQAQMFNYGLRTMYDFMVPEPAAFIIEALKNIHANAVKIEAPENFDLLPNEITEENYHKFVHKYGADVSPPPEIYKTKSLDFNNPKGDDNTEFTHSGQIGIDDGYEALQGSVACVWTVWEKENLIDIALGSKTHRLTGDGNWVWVTDLDGERGSIPFALITFKCGSIAAAVEVKCQRTARAMTKWQLETHSKIMEAYKAKRMEYEEKLASLEAQAGITIQGKNPALNMEMMKDELKKNCVSILTEQHFDLFDAISTDPDDNPEINLYENKAEGPYVRFFEQAFEWEHMTWVTYPYFWGRKSQWKERIAYEDTDPIFNQFLKSGYCRVVVPARPGFEGAIDHFMHFGEPWNGGPLPPISSGLYLPIADEIAERLSKPEDEFPQGDPWLVKIPTTLIKLRPNGDLPKWTQNADGEWEEVD